MQRQVSNDSDRIPRRQLVKKAITFIAIFAVTITLGILELVSVRTTLTSLEDIIADFSIRYEQNKDNITIFYDELGDLKEYWENQEDWLCYIFNHRDLSTITDSINRLIPYTKNNDYDNAISELSLLKEYSTKSYHIMGFNMHNIF